MKEKTVQAAYQQLAIVPRPPGPPEGPGEEYETGGIPIMINEEWYRLGSYQARYAAAEMMAVSSHKQSAVVWAYVSTFVWQQIACDDRKAWGRRRQALILGTTARSHGQRRS